MGNSSGTPRTIEATDWELCGGGVGGGRNSENNQSNRLGTFGGNFENSRSNRLGTFLGNSENSLSNRVGTFWGNPDNSLISNRLGTFLGNRENNVTNRRGTFWDLREQSNRLRCSLGTPRRIDPMGGGELFGNFEDNLPSSGNSLGTLRIM